MDKTEIQLQFETKHRSYQRFSGEKFLSINTL